MNQIPEWMNECADCRRLLAAVLLVELPLAEIELLTAHLVAEHLAQLPGYAPDCPNCIEWQAMAGDPGDGLTQTYGRHVVPMLGREDLRHRAGHLVTPLLT